MVSIRSNAAALTLPGQRRHSGGKPAWPDDDISVEEELAFRLAGTEACRVGHRERIGELLPQADAELLVGRLDEQRLLALLGSRLIETCDHLELPGLRRAVESELAEARRRHTLNAHFTHEFCQRLERSGIAVLPLKGALLAERLYADPSLRSPGKDIDFLVHQDLLDDAVELFRQLGYELEDDVTWAGGLPHYHYGLAPTVPGLPRVELHWRIHWYEKSFAPRMLDRSSRDEHGERTPALADELATLLIIFARDGFVGLRLAVDIGAWWDAYEAELAVSGLEGIMEENPRLRATLLAGMRAAQELVGLPVGRLVSKRWTLSRRSNLALRLINWRQRGTPREVAANITLVDLLLTPIGAAHVYFRHYYFQPLAKYVRDYGWSPDTRVRNELLREVHVAARIVKSVWRYSRRLWSIRHARLDALPAMSALGEAQSRAPQ
jgi:Uncharacterised nucleotidyltransferase